MIISQLSSGRQLKGDWLEVGHVKHNNSGAFDVLSLLS